MAAVETWVAVGKGDGAGGNAGGHRPRQRRGRGRRPAAVRAGEAACHGGGGGRGRVGGPRRRLAPAGWRGRAAAAVETWTRTGARATVCRRVRGDAGGGGRRPWRWCGRGWWRTWATAGTETSVGAGVNLTVFLDEPVDWGPRPAGRTVELSETGMSWSVSPQVPLLVPTSLSSRYTSAFHRPRLTGSHPMGGSRFSGGGPVPRHDTTFCDV